MIGSESSRTRRDLRRFRIAGRHIVPNPGSGQLFRVRVMAGTHRTDSQSAGLESCEVDKEAAIPLLLFGRGREVWKYMRLRAEEVILLKRHIVQDRFEVSIDFEALAPFVDRDHHPLPCERDTS